MPHLSKSFPIKARDFSRAGDVSIQIHGLLKAIGFGVELIRRVSICAYEAEMNVVMHGGDGNLLLSVDEERIVIEVEDDGPGIENIEMALKEGFSTASKEDRERGFGAGMGLPNIQRNADCLDIYSEKGEGTHLRTGFMVKQDDGRTLAE